MTCKRCGEPCGYNLEGVGVVCAICIDPEAINRGTGLQGRSGEAMKTTDAVRNELRHYFSPTPDGVQREIDKDVCAALDDLDDLRAQLTAERAIALAERERAKNAERALSETTEGFDAPHRIEKADERGGIYMWSDGHRHSYHPTSALENERERAERAERMVAEVPDRMRRIAALADQLASRDAKLAEVCEELRRVIAVSTERREQLASRDATIARLNHQHEIDEAYLASREVVIKRLLALEVCRNCGKPQPYTSCAWCGETLAPETEPSQ